MKNKFKKKGGGGGHTQHKSKNEMQISKVQLEISWMLHSLATTLHAQRLHSLLAAALILLGYWPISSLLPALSA